MKIVKIFLIAIVLTGMVGGLTSWQYAEQSYNEAEYAPEALNDASERNVKAGTTRRTETLQGDLNAELPHRIKKFVANGRKIPQSLVNQLSTSQKEVMEAYNYWLNSDYSRMDEKQKEDTKARLDKIITFRGVRNVINAYQIRK